jgi:hypothetical protein
MILLATKTIEVHFQCCQEKIPTFGGKEDSTRDEGRPSVSSQIKVRYTHTVAKAGLDSG